MHVWIGSSSCSKSYFYSICDTKKQKGAFTVAAKTGVPVIPMTLIGTGEIMPAGMEHVVNSGSVKLIIHKPIRGSDPEILRQLARNTILDTLSIEAQKRNGFAGMKNSDGDEKVINLEFNCV